jgi:alkylation response protein AidB-like acyl-CoA dehydrogenase
VGADARALPPARLLAYRVIALQSEGTVTPGDAAAYRIAVTRLDQDSAEVLMEIGGLASLPGADGRRFRLEVDDHWRYSQASTVASGSIEMQRILLARAMLKAPAPRASAARMPEQATTPGRQASA